MKLNIGQKFIENEGYGIGADSWKYRNVYEIVAINEEMQKVKLQLVARSISDYNCINMHPVELDVLDTIPFWCRIVESCDGKAFWNHNRNVWINVKNCVESVNAIQFKDWMINELNRGSHQWCEYEDYNEEELESLLIQTIAGNEQWQRLHDIEIDIKYWKNKIKEEKITEAK